MITEEEYRQYHKEIDEYIDKCVKDSKYFSNTEKWQNDLRIKSLKCNIYRLSKSVSKYYYYLKNPDEAVREALNIDRLEKQYDELTEKLDDLKYVEKIFYSSPYIRRQYIDDNTDIKDIRKEIDRIEERLERIERNLNKEYDNNKVEQIMEKYRYKYNRGRQQLNLCQKELNEIENQQHL